MSNNRTWLAFANRKRCRHSDAIHSLGFISWRMGRVRFSIGDIVYLFMSDERCVRFKMWLLQRIANVKIRHFG